MTAVDEVLVSIGRVIGKPRGWERVVRAVAPPGRVHGSGLRPLALPEGHVFPVDRGTLIGWSVHFFGTYEPEVQAEIRRWLRPGDVAIDVGANVGWHTLLMGARVGPAGRVHAFEPNETTRARLVAAVQANSFAHVIVDARAVADRRCVAAFEAPAAGHVWDGTGHLLGQAERAGSARGHAGVPGAAAALGRSAEARTASSEPRHRRQLALEEGPQRQRKEVECLTLDAFAAERGIDRLALLKIDVEGWELPVLRGARQVLESLRPAIVFEIDPEYLARGGGTAADLMAGFTDADYLVFSLHPRRAPVRVTTPGGRAGNFLAVPREKAAP